MIQASDWAALLYLRPEDFKYPDKLEFEAVNKLDRFVGMVGSRPIVLSDWRPYDPSNPESRHFVGDAIDTTWPKADPLDVLALAKSSGLWQDGGLGMYINELGVVSFHMDTRGERARWGGVVTHPYVEGELVKKIEYTGLDAVVDLVKKNIPATFATVILLTAFVYVISKRG